MKPILKWAGGKARLATQIDFAFVEGCAGRYIEPFVGSAAVFLYRWEHRRVGRAVLADVNAKLVEFHRAIRDDADGVLGALAEMPCADFRNHYTAVRDAYNQGPFVGVEHAARFLWLNRAGFNVRYRENSSGKFNVPVGSYAKLSLPTAEHVRAVSRALADVEFVVAPFERAIAMADAGDQVYCDPPYVPLSPTSNFTGYSSEPFGLREQRLLAQCAEQAARAGARVVLSNHDVPIVRDELYPVSAGYRYVSSPMVTRSVSKDAASRGQVPEVIAAIGPLHALAA